MVTQELERANQMDGIINVKKEAGMTSHDVVFKLRKILGTKKIGHGGTLDPDVVGVLPIAVGKATRMVEFMQDEGKIYEGEITLGFSTTTEDASGEIVEQTPVEAPLDAAEVDRMIAQMVGEIEQVPPMYSAVKVNGRKLYEYARAGEEVERPVRQVTIYEFTRTSEIGYEEGLARFRFRVKCSKGTYIRTLSVDLGQKLGYAAHMSHLTRTSAAGLLLADALTLEEVAEKVAQGDLSFLHPLEIGTGDLEKVDYEFIGAVINRRLPNPFMPDAPQRIATDTSQKLAIRFGETIKAYEARGLDKSNLILIPLVLAGYARYLKGIDDNGQPFEISTDPLLAELQAIVAPLKVEAGEQDFSCMKALYSRTDVFGVDLYAVGLGEKIESMAKELFAGPGAVRATLHKYVKAR